MDIATDLEEAAAKVSKLHVTESADGAHPAGTDAKNTEFFGTELVITTPVEPGLKIARGLASSTRIVAKQRFVHSPGKYDIIFFILVPEEIERLFWTRDGSYPGSYRLETEEVICKEHAVAEFRDGECRPGTRGFYVTREELLDESLMNRALLEIFLASAVHQHD